MLTLTRRSWFALLGAGFVRAVVPARAQIPVPALWGHPPQEKSAALDAMFQPDLLTKRRISAALAVRTARSTGKLRLA